MIQNWKNPRIQLFKWSALLFMLLDNLGVLHWYLSESIASWLTVGFKCFPMWQLIKYVGSRQARKDYYTKKIYLGLCASVLGDGILVYQEKHEIAFLIGLLMFLIGHCFYLQAFGYDRFRPEIFFVAVVQGLLVYGLLYSHKLGQDTIVLKVGCFVYGFALYCMFWRAWSRVKKFKFSEGLTIEWTAAIGATLFVFSDNILAIQKFCFSVPANKILIMSTYYAAQMCVASSVVV